MATFYEKILEYGDWTTLLSVFVICLATYLYIQWIQRIPGPIGLPYLGYYPFLTDENLHKELAEMTKKYGDVFCFTITGQTYAHIGSHKSMREAFITKSNCFITKSQNFNLLLDSVGGGVFYSSGEPWKVLRRFFSQKLKDYGMGKKTQEVWMMDSLQRTIDALKNSAQKDFDATEFFTENCTVTIRQLLFGSANVDEKDVKRLIEGFKIYITTMTGRRLLLAGPFFKYIMLPFLSTTPSFKTGLAEMNFCLKKILRQHETDFDKDNIRNLVDCFIDERRILEEKGDPRSEIYSEKAFVDSIIQIAGDGALTIGALVGAVMKEISGKPEVQKRIQSEVDEVVGRECFPSWGLKNQMPYTVAVIYETIRTNTFFPFFPSLECTEDTTVCGCPIPKGTILLQNFHSAFMDPRVYEDPGKFDPTRFLPNEDKPKIELPSVFGTGKRSCIGESLANMETFLFVTTIMQNFDLLPATPKKQKIGLEWNTMIKAVPRKS